MSANMGKGRPASAYLLGTVGYGLGCLRIGAVIILVLAALAVPVYTLGPKAGQEA
jgi:hypothetical protein